MHPAAADFVERMGVTLECEGYPRISGRLLGFLMVHPEAFSLDDLAEELQVSKASISTNARQLENHRFLERVSAPGDRRDYYRLAPDAWEAMLRAAQHKWQTIREILTGAAASFPDEMETARARLIEAEQFHLLMIDGVERMIERWGRRATARTNDDTAPVGASEER